MSALGVTYVAFSADGRKLVSIGDAIRVWDTNSWRELTTMQTVEPKDGVVNAREWLDFATERVPQMQEEKMKQSRGLGLNIAFTEGEQKIADPEKRSVQRPRVFYRREMEADPLVVAKTSAPRNK